MEQIVKALFSGVTPEAMTKLIEEVSEDKLAKTYGKIGKLIYSLLPKKPPKDPKKREKLVIPIYIGICVFMKRFGAELRNPELMGTCHLVAAYICDRMDKLDEEKKAGSSKTKKTPSKKIEVVIESVTRHDGLPNN